MFTQENWLLSTGYVVSDVQLAENVTVTFDDVQDDGVYPNSEDVPAIELAWEMTAAELVQEPCVASQRPVSRTTCVRVF